MIPQDNRKALLRYSWGFRNRTVLYHIRTTQSLHNVVRHPCREVLVRWLYVLIVIWHIGNFALRAPDAPNGEGRLLRHPYDNHDTLAASVLFFIFSNTFGVVRVLYVPIPKYLHYITKYLKKAFWRNEYFWARTFRVTPRIISKLIVLVPFSVDWIL